MKPFALKKKTRRQLKKTGKAVRKALKRAGGPAGIATGALTLGGLAAYAVMDPDVRTRTRELAGAARDLFRQVTGGDAARDRDQPLLHQAH
jgi:hypothetical protein